MGVALQSAYLTIPVSSFERSAAWYGEHLGFRVTKSDSLYMELRNEAGIKILFLPGKNRTSQMVYPDGAELPVYGFMVADAADAYRYFQDRGLKVGPFFDYEGQSFSFYDPDGNFIEVWSVPGEAR